MKNVFLGIPIALFFMQIQTNNTVTNNEVIDYNKIDTGNMYNKIFNFPSQLEHASRISQNINYQRQYNNINAIVCAGMGGSGIAGNIAELFTKSQLTIPFVTVKNYTLPHWCNEQTLVILVSYSGNTEETLACFQEALAKKSQIIGITSGGKLQKQLSNYNFDIISIPAGLPPRAALGYLAVPILYCLYQLQLIATNPTNELLNTCKTLKKSQTLFSQATNDNPSFKLAQQLQNKLPIIYGETETSACIATRWRTQLAENSKVLANTQILPELNHNEIVGWHETTLKNIGIIWLLDDAMHPRNKLRYHFSKNIICNHGGSQYEVTSSGNSLMERIFYLIYFGDWVSFWLAIMNNVNPTAIDNINQLKELMSTV
ncbi:MAG: bifunctional phosphoglucose/phosphomannose isomerase [Candidatus Babeliales bacterium]